MTLPNLPRPPRHPGDLLREEVLDAQGWTAASLGQRLGVSRQTIHKIVRGDGPVTPQMALRLGVLCGNGPWMWLRMQQSYDLYHARLSLGDTLDGIEGLALHLPER